MEFKVTCNKYQGLRVIIRFGYRALELKLKMKRYLTPDEIWKNHVSTRTEEVTTEQLS